MIRSLILITISFLFTYASCKKQLEANNGNGRINIIFENRMGDQPLIMHSGHYKNAIGEDLTVSLFNYYISNIELLRSNGSVYTVPRDSSYFLIRGEDSLHQIVLNNIPAGAYNGIRFTLGIDSLKSASPVAERTGVLDPAGVGAGMYWSWHSGYIFVKMEGVSPVATSSDKKYRYHIGGFGGYSKPMFNNIKRIELPFPDGVKLMVRSSHKATIPQINMYVDALKVLDGPMNISIAAKTTVMVHPFSVNIANNYASMFTVHGIRNAKTE